MDQLNTGFGSLRVSGVQDFVPAAMKQQQQQQSQSQSQKAPLVMKEFVPGRGLVSETQSSSSNSNNNNAASAAPSKVREFVPGKGLVDSSQQRQQQQGYMNSGSGASQVQSDPAYQNSRFPTYDRRQNQTASTLGPQSMEESGQIHGMFTSVRDSLQTVPRRKTLRSLLLPDDVHTYFAGQARMTISSLEPDDPLIKEVPRKFHSVLPLDSDPSQRNTAGSTGYPTSVFKAVNSKDGFVYAVRRVDNVRAYGNLHQIISTWSKVVNANVVPLREIFSQNKALFVVHDYLPGAQTLREFILARGTGALLPENIIWSIITQLLSAVRAVHAAGIACRDLGPSRVLLTGRHRARLACAGLVHALEPTPTVVPLLDQQFEDILWIGRLTICIATMSLQGLTDLQSSVKFMQSVYSNELTAFALHAFKLHHSNQKCSIYDLLGLSSQALLAENDALYAHGDALEENLARMYDCDRMFRLMSKISLICERPPPPGMKPADSWSETDDRYLIKLFRDYVFHQIDDRGRPVMDFGHIIQCLNKLDAGSTERLLLASRDGRSFLVVSYEDVRLCIEKAFQELIQFGLSHHQE